MDFRSSVVNKETMLKVTNMVVNQVSLGIGVIDVASDDKFGLTLESNINISNQFDVVVAGGVKAVYIIMQLITSVSKKSLEINH